MDPNSFNSPPLKIFLVEDSILTQQRLAALIGTVEGVEIAGEAEDASTALRGIAASESDVAVVDLHLSQSSGMSVLAALAQSSHPVITIVLTNHSTASVREACLSAGANYFFDKTSEFKLALYSIRKIARESLSGTTGYTGEDHV